MGKYIGDEDEKAKEIKQLINDGSNISGAAAGAAIGLLGGPVGAVIGAASGAVISGVLSRVGSEVQKRFTSPREHIRMGAVAGYAGAAIARRLSAGEQLRDDGFFDGAEATPSNAEEILEGVFLKAKDSYQEKKILYLGELYASIAFDKTINADYANMLIALAGELTYTQYILLAVGYSNPNSRLRGEAYALQGEAVAILPKATVSVLTQLFRLGQSDLVSDGSAWMGSTHVVPSAYKTDGVGTTLVEMMGLQNMPEADRELIYIALGPL